MSSIEQCPYPLVFPTDTAPASFAAITTDVNKEGLAYRCSTRALQGMQKEAIVSNGNGGRTWRMVCDEGPYLHGTDLAPFPLAFFCTGMASSYLGELLVLLREHKVPFRHLRLLQDNRYSMEGSATAGTMKGGALPVELQLEIDSPATPDELQQVLAEAVAASPVGALLRQRIPGLFSLQLNDCPLELTRLGSCANPGPPCPGSFDHLRPVSVAFAGDLICKLKAAETRTDAPGGVGSSLAENQKRILHMRGICEPRPDGLLETVVELYQPLGSRFRFLSDTGQALGGEERAPDSLAYLSAGIAFCYMTQLGRYAHILKRPLAAYQLVQDTCFSLPGASGGTRSPAAMEPVQTHVYISSTEDPAYVQTLTAMGEQTCFLHAACRDAVVVRIKPVITLATH